MKLCPMCEAEYADDVKHCVSDGQTLVKLKAQETSLIGRVLNNRYRLVEKIGVGGMGTVYKAIQEPANRPVALKILHTDLAHDKDAVRRFFNEAKVVSRLRHPNTVTLYDFGQSDTGELYIAMELMTGVSLAYLIEQKNLSLPELLEITDQVCQSLQEAHDLSIVHRDLKPDNVFIDRVGNRNIVKVLDFGIAKIPDSVEHLTRTGMVFGTPTYMSPEQAQGHDLDPRSDIYTLGIVLYHALAGEPPFVADRPMQIALKQVTTAPRPIHDMSLHRPLPQQLSALVMDMLEKDPTRRPQTLKNVRERLLRVARELPGMKIEVAPESGETLVTASPVDTLKAAWKGDTLEAPQLLAAERTQLVTATGAESRHITGELDEAVNLGSRRTLVTGVIALTCMVLMASAALWWFRDRDVPRDQPDLSLTSRIPAPAHHTAAWIEQWWTALGHQWIPASTMRKVAGGLKELVGPLLSRQPCANPASPQAQCPEVGRPGIQASEGSSRPATGGGSTARTRPRRQSTSSSRTQTEEEAEEQSVSQPPRPVLLPPVTIPLPDAD